MNVQTKRIADRSAKTPDQTAARKAALADAITRHDTSFNDFNEGTARAALNKAGVITDVQYSLCKRLVDTSAPFDKLDNAVAFCATLAAPNVDATQAGALNGLITHCDNGVDSTFLFCEVLKGPKLTEESAASIVKLVRNGRDHNAQETEDAVLEVLGRPPRERPEGQSFISRFDADAAVRTVVGAGNTAKATATRLASAFARGEAKTDGIEEKVAGAAGKILQGLGGTVRDLAKK
jgi:hypothetical protein